MPAGLLGLGAQAGDERGVGKLVEERDVEGGVHAATVARRRAQRNRSTERRHSRRGAGRLAALVVAAVEGATVVSRAERHPGRRSSSAAELEDVIA
ncbi:MAG: hypothetical protein ACRDNR_00450, partial [Gaiellaceae bacterium]